MMKWEDHRHIMPLPIDSSTMSHPPFINFTELSWSTSLDPWSSFCRSRKHDSNTVKYIFIPRHFFSSIRHSFMFAVNSSMPAIRSTPKLSSSTLFKCSSSHVWYRCNTSRSCHSLYTSVVYVDFLWTLGHMSSRCSTKKVNSCTNGRPDVSNPKWYE